MRIYGLMVQQRQNLVAERIVERVDAHPLDPGRECDPIRITVPVQSDGTAQTVKRVRRVAESQKRGPEVGVCWREAGVDRQGVSVMRD